MSEKTVHRLLVLLVFLVPLIVYWLTMAATVSLWDAGEFISTAYILGIAHSPGTPLFTLVGRVFAMLPLPMSIAQRVNLISVFLAAVSIVMAYLVMVETIRFMYPQAKGRLWLFAQYAGPVIGCLYLTFSTTAWRDSTETEVYSLIAFVTGLCTWLALLWYKNPAGHALAGEVPKTAGAGESREARLAGAAAIEQEERLERGHARGIFYLIIYLMALGIGFHLGTVLVYGGIFLLFLLVKEKAFANDELIIGSFGLAVLVGGMTLWRSGAATIAMLIVWGLLIVWSMRKRGLFALAAAGLVALGISVHLYLYIRAHLHPEINMVDPQTWNALVYHLRREQYPPINMFHRKASLLWQFGHFGRYFLEQFRMFGDAMLGSFNLGKAATAIPVALGFLGIVANFNRERKTWALNFANVFINTVGLILFLNFSASEVRERDYFYAPGFYFFAIFIGIGATAFLAWTADYVKSKAKEAAAYVVPLGSVLVILSILPAHYNWFDHNRSHDYMARDYGYNVLASLEPNAIVFTYGDNDTYPLWYMQCVERFRKDVSVANASLLNTDWYIRQLRDEEPKVPITLTDKQIEDLQPIPLSGGAVAWKNDLATQHIIETTRWKRPIYFASTCREDYYKPYESYLERQGLVMRLVPRQGKDIMNEFMLKRDLEVIYKFRGLLTKNRQEDTTTFKDEDGLDIILVNYAVAMGELAYLRARDKDYAGAARYMEIALRFTPLYKPGRIILGTYYLMNNETAKAADYYRTLLKREPTEGEYWMRLAMVYDVEGQLPIALQNIDEGIRLTPDFRPLYQSGFQYAAQLGDAEAAKGYISKWLARHPDDQQFRDLDQNVDHVLKEDFGVPAGKMGTKKGVGK